MDKENFSTAFVSHSSMSQNMETILHYVGNKSIEIENLSDQNFISAQNSSENVDYNDIITPLIKNNSDSFSEEDDENQIEKKLYFIKVNNIKKRNKFFKVIYPFCLFTEADQIFHSNKVAKISLGRKRSLVRKGRLESNDNIRTKLKRAFLNALIKLLNEKLRSIGSKKFLTKFPRVLTGDITKERNKDIVNMDLGEIFTNEKLYINKNENGLKNFFHNSKIVQSKEIKENIKFKKYLNMTFRELYEEYICSNEFLKDEINHLKQKGMGDKYIIRYKFMAKGLIEFFDN